VKPGKLFIDGKFVDAKSGETFETLNPATGEVLTQVAAADKADVDKAVAAARRAFESGPYPKMSARERGQMLMRLSRLVLEHADELARLESLDNGKPITETRYVDIPASAATLEYYGGWADKVEGTVIPVNGFLNYTRREPVGVVGQIIPWNFPLLMFAWKIAPAIACGNTVVIKPAEQTPLSACKFGELCEEAGVPKGVINIIHGFGETAGAAMTAHPDIDKIAFTGEWRTGQIIMKACAGNLKRLSLELGGKSPNIVFDDADIPAAIKGAMAGIFFNQGEVCCAGSRLFVQSGVHKEFIQEFAHVAKSIKVGDPLDPATQQGAQVSEEQMNKILQYVQVGLRGGQGDAGDGGQARRRAGVFRAADDLRRRDEHDADRAGGDLRAGGGGDRFRGHRRGDRRGQPDDVRAGGGGLDEGHPEGAPRGARAAGGDGVGELLQRVRRGVAVRGLQVQRIRP
jgi:aldehyde dehydrogenase (NAD+)